MSMKKSIFLLAAAAAAFASCTQNEVMEVAENRAIGFAGTGVDNITKADITSADFAQFYVYGGYDENAIFNGISVTNTGGNWGYSPVQYWVNGTWNFAGYAGGNGVAPTWDNASGTLTLAVNSDADNQDDLVYADAKSIVVTDATTYSTPVTLNFTHLLSKIQFKFTKESKSLGGVNVTLQNFSVNGITTNAKWTGNVQGNADSPATGAYTAFPDATAIDGTNGLSTDAYYVIPQAVGTFNITAEAVITDANNTEIKKGNVTAVVPTTFSWEAQKVYIYTAELKYENIVSEDPNKDPKPIEFTASAANWDPSVNEGTITPDPQP